MQVAFLILKEQSLEIQSEVFRFSLIKERNITALYVSQNTIST